MNRPFVFTLTNEEYLDFLRFQAIHSRLGRGKRLWIATSIPAVLICTAIFFKLYTKPVWLVALALLALVWVFDLSPRLWAHHVRRRIQENTLEQIGIKGFQQTTLRFLEDRVVCKDQKERTIGYNQIERMTPCGSSLVFWCSQQGALLLPLRLFEGKEDLNAFIRAFEPLWNKQRKKA